MARLIDADALLAEYDRQHEGEPGKARKLIEDAPTINRPTRSQFKRMAAQLGYEPVVHCEDCRLGEPDMIVNGYKDDIWCNYYEHPKPADGFCEKGKRRTNENEPDGTRALENGSVDSLPVMRRAEVRRP